MSYGGPRSMPGRGALSAVLTSTMAIGTLAPFALAALSPFIVRELEFTRTQFGLLVTIYFLVGALLSPTLGSFVDRVGGWLMMLVLIGVSSGAFLFMAGFPSYVFMLVAMALAGVANALANPTTNRVIGTQVAPGQRGVIVGVKQSGVQVGAALAGLALPGLAIAFGWRAGLVACSLVAMLVGVVAWGIRPPRVQRLPASAQAESGREFRWLIIYAFLMGCGVAVATTYLVLFAYEELHMSEAWAGRTLGIMSAVSVVARIAWAALAERRDNPSRVLAAIAGLGALSSALFWVAPTVGGSVVPWTAVALVGASAAAWNSVGMLAVIDSKDSANTGRISGNVLAGFFSGNVVSAAAAGALVDRVGSYAPVWALTVGVFATAGLVAALERRGEQRRAGVRIERS